MEIETPSCTSSVSPQIPTGPGSRPKDQKTRRTSASLDTLSASKKNGATSCSLNWSRFGGHWAWRLSATCTSAQRHSARSSSNSVTRGGFDTPNGKKSREKHLCSFFKSVKSASDRKSVV